MSVIVRLAEIVSANVNAILDRAENPEWLAGQIIRDMEDGLDTARRLAATAIAHERHLGRDLEQNCHHADLWKSKAREALAANREDLARQALARKHGLDELVRALEVQHIEAVATSANVRAALRTLEARLSEARCRQRTLLARHRAVKVQSEVNRFLGKGYPDLGYAQSSLARLENRLTEFENEALAFVELHPSQSRLEEEFANLERTRSIEEELEALKRENGNLA